MKKLACTDGRDEAWGIYGRGLRGPVIVLLLKRSF